MDEKVSPNFWLSELLHSDTAVRLGIPNVPKTVALANVRNVLAPGLERIRALLGKPVLVSSGYRSPELNAAVHGAANSAHLLGLAADFRAPAFGTPLQIAKALSRFDAAVEVNFDQLIQEGTWVHVGFAAPGKIARREVLTAHFSAGGVRYSAGLA